MSLTFILRILGLFLLTTNIIMCQMKGYQIDLVGGTGAATSTGNNGRVTSATFIGPRTTWQDSVGNLYTTESGANVLRKIIKATDTIVIVAGIPNTVNSFAGDGFAASSASLSFPMSMFIDTLGKIYFTDCFSFRIRVISVTNIISTVVGMGTQSSVGDGGRATSATLNIPHGVWLSTAGIMFVAEHSGGRVRRIDGSNIITTFAGIGTLLVFSGENIRATSAQLYSTERVYGDTLGVIYIADSGNNRVRVIANNIITTLIGSGGAATSTGDGGKATAATINYPVGLWLDKYTGHLFVCDQDGHTVRMVHGTTSIITVFAGTTNTASVTPTANNGDGGPASSATLKQSDGVYGDTNGNLYLGDRGNNKIRKMFTFAPTSQPSSQPSGQPSRQPSNQPSRQPTKQPSTQPTCQPTSQPFPYPSSAPSCQPSSGPSQQPTSRPSTQPTRTPSCQPSGQPFSAPSSQPSTTPSQQPTSAPTCQPSALPTIQPTSTPSMHPSSQPVADPTTQPTTQPTSVPTSQPSNTPSQQPSSIPTSNPTSQPTTSPSSQPRSCPSSQPSTRPTSQPSQLPSSQPLTRPSVQPSARPSQQPSSEPSSQPNTLPTTKPSGLPSGIPSNQPTVRPSGQPTSFPSLRPSSQPSSAPLSEPTSMPTSQPSSVPSIHPSEQPTGQPSSAPTHQPSSVPSMQPSSSPSSQPSSRPSSCPTNQPSALPSSQPSAIPTLHPSSLPTGQPSNRPSSQPTTIPSGQPTCAPTTQPSIAPSGQPFSQPSSLPSLSPSRQPSSQPSNQPSKSPSAQPTDTPTTHPTISPSLQPSGNPSAQPSALPSSQPTRSPTIQPTTRPTCQPSRNPTAQPSVAPSSQPSGQPSQCPSPQPTSSPTGQPSATPSKQPSSQPTSQPTSAPSVQPSTLPSCQPSMQPSTQPSVQPSTSPTKQPTQNPTISPSSQPASRPSSQPSRQPQALPSTQPLSPPSSQPFGAPTRQPTSQPSVSPTKVALTQGTLPASQPLRVISHHLKELSQFKVLLPFGQTIAVPGIGYGDVVLNSADVGTSYVVFGAGNRSSSHIILSNLVYGQVYRAAAAVSYDYSGRSVSNSGDVNGDGYDDLIIGVPYAARCYVLFGTSQGFVNMTEGFTIFGAHNVDLTGWSVSGAGDVNNDTFADIIIGAPNAVNSIGEMTGAVYVLYGRRNAFTDIFLSANMGKKSGFVVYGASQSDYLGVSASRAGDVNGDGFSDIVAGAMVVTSFNSGAVYVIYGADHADHRGTHRNALNVSSLAPHQGATLRGSRYSLSGFSVSDAGDVNGDGYDDVLIGCFPQAGSATALTYVVYGSSIGVPSILLASIAANQGLVISGGGVVVSGVGDINHDGYDDILIGSNIALTGAGFVIHSNVTFVSSPSHQPTFLPSNAPTRRAVATRLPTNAPATSSHQPTTSYNPSTKPATIPSQTPSLRPTQPTIEPTPGGSQPTSRPSAVPTKPTTVPSVEPSEEPTAEPTLEPTEMPSAEPSDLPTCKPTRKPSARPTPLTPTKRPAVRRTTRPYSQPSVLPTDFFSLEPTITPSAAQYVRVPVTSGGSYVRTANNTNFVLNSVSDLVIARASNSSNMFTVLPHREVTYTVHHFNAPVDRINLVAFKTVRSIADVNITAGSAIVTLPNQQFLRFVNIHPHDLTPHHFIFNNENSVPDAPYEEKPATLSLTWQIVIFTIGLLGLGAVCGYSCHVYSVRHKTELAMFKLTTRLAKASYSADVDTNLAVSEVEYRRRHLDQVLLFSTTKPVGYVEYDDDYKAMESESESDVNSNSNSSGRGRANSINGDDVGNGGGGGGGGGGCGGYNSEKERTSSCDDGRKDSKVDHSSDHATQLSGNNHSAHSKLSQPCQFGERAAASDTGSEDSQNSQTSSRKGSSHYFTPQVVEPNSNYYLSSDDETTTTNSNKALNNYKQHVKQSNKQHSKLHSIDQHSSASLDSNMQQLQQFSGVNRNHSEGSLEYDRSQDYYFPKNSDIDANEGIQKAAKKTDSTLPETTNQLNQSRRINRRLNGGISISIRNPTVEKSTEVPLQQLEQRKQTATSKSKDNSEYYLSSDDSDQSEHKLEIAINNKGNGQNQLSGELGIYRDDFDFENDQNY